MKILVVRVGRLGDIVMILPAIAAIKKQYPQADIYALTSRDGMRLLKAYGLPPEHLHCYSNHLLKRPQQIHQVRCFLRNNQFDRIYCFEQKKRTIAWLPESAQILDNQNEQDHYALRCVKMVEKSPDPIQAMPYLPLPATDISAQLKSNGITDKTCLIGIHPTYSGFNKLGRRQEKKHRLWPTQAFADLILRLDEFATQNQLDVRVMMDLLPEEKTIGDEIAALCQNKVMLQCAPPDFQRYLAYLHRLDALVAPNTGVMHLAAALNTPTVALFSGAQPSDCGPYMHPDRYRIVHARDYGGSQACMANIPAKAVIKSLLSLLDANLTNVSETMTTVDTD